MSNPQNASFFKEILQDYSDWSSQVILAAFYPEKILMNSVEAPASLFNSLDELIKRNVLSEAQVEDIAQIQTELHEATAAIVDLKGEKPDFETFNKFLRLFEAFIERLERLQLDSVLSNFGVDVETGLRSASVIKTELERELERRARRGQPFSVVMCLIDRATDASLPEQMKVVSAALKMCMRSFDDAYLSGKNEILISLKQTENEGALKFVERLKNALGRLKANFTMSFCVAEPEPGENVETLLMHIRGDLHDIAKERAGDAAEFEDISPLQRFIKNAARDEKK
jgi:GGDEF domain-containing protein